MGLIISSIILFLIVVVLLVYLLMLKSELRNVKRDLINTRKEDNNQQIAITLIDRDLTEMSSEINRNLDYHIHLKLEA